MVEVEVQVPTHVQSDSVPDVVEWVFSAEGLTLTLKGTLAKYPACIHWHFKKGKERGTLEVTWWERERRLWLKVADGRKGEWLEETIARLKSQFEQSLL